MPFEKDVCNAKKKVHFILINSSSAHCLLWTDRQLHIEQDNTICRASYTSTMSFACRMEIMRYKKLSKQILCNTNNKKKKHLMNIIILILRIMPSVPANLLRLRISWELLRFGLGQRKTHFHKDSLVDSKYKWDRLAPFLYFLYYGLCFARYLTIRHRELSARHRDVYYIHIFIYYHIKLRVIIITSECAWQCVFASLGAACTRNLIETACARSSDGVRVYVLCVCVYMFKVSTFYVAANAMMWKKKQRNMLKTANRFNVRHKTQYSQNCRVAKILCSL